MSDISKIKLPNGDIYNLKDSNALHSNDTYVQDMQIDNTSIVNNGIANISPATSIAYGVAKMASDSMVKAGTDYRSFLTPLRSHKSTFYGLAKAAGSDMKDSNNAIGTYTNEAKGAIQHMLGTDTVIAPYEADATADKSYAIGDTFMMNGKLYKVTAAIAQNGVITPNSNCVETNIDESYVKDVQVNGISIISNGIANIQKASSTNFGVVKASIYGVDDHANGGIFSLNDELIVVGSNASKLRAGADLAAPVTAGNQHCAVFYGLAKAAGDTTQSASNNTVGTYTNEAKSAIQVMLGVGTIDETITSTTPTINAVANHRYKCGEISLLDFTPCTYGICEVMFTSGSTPTVLTLPNTVKMPEWFELESNRIYDIIITDGTYGAVTSWAV